LLKLYIKITVCNCILAAVLVRCLSPIASFQTQGQVRIYNIMTYAVKTL